MAVYAGGVRPSDYDLLEDRLSTEPRDIPGSESDNQG
jgi:hypothetical protein